MSQKLRPRELQLLFLLQHCCHLLLPHLPLLLLRFLLCCLQRRCFLLQQCCCCWWCCCWWCRCCCWRGAALRLESTRASRASDAAGGVAGGSDRGSTVEVEGGGCGGPLSLFDGRVRGLGGQPGGRGFDQATEDRGQHRGDRSPGGRTGLIRMVFTPVGGTEASGTLHSCTLAPEGRVVVTT